ncbi:MAG: porin [Roseiarcus sp.]|jgi:predicted porin
MRSLNAIVWSCAAALVVGAAQAADLPTTKAPPAPPATNCYASFYSWLDSTAADCPLTFSGITVYGQIDVGGGYETHATAFNKDYSNGVSELVNKNSGNAAWQAVPNGLSQSNVGVKIKEAIVPDWFLVGDADFGFDPYSLQAANGPKSLLDNYNVNNMLNQTANGDSSRAGQWDNTRAYIGVSNPTFGTLTWGRQYSFSNDISSTYDPFGGAYAFSLIGTSGTVEQGTGDTETARYNDSVKYQVAYNGFRAGGIVQIGGWEQGNGARAAYQADIGGDWGGFSVDAVYAYDKDAVKLSTFPPSGLPTDATALKATLADVNAGVIAAKYKWDKWTFYGGYEYAVLSTPSDLASIFGPKANNLVAPPPSGSANGDYYTLNGYTAIIAPNAYVKPDDQQVVWLGAKYAILSNLDAAVGYYYEWQNNYTVVSAVNVPADQGYTSTACGLSTANTANGGGPATANANHSSCAGHQEAISGMLDWRPVKRVDIYAGVMYSDVTGGFANMSNSKYYAIAHDNNTAFTGGVRVAF